MDNSRPFTQYDQTGSHASFSVGGMPSVSRVDYPLPKDPHAPPGYDPDGNQAETNDYGINERVEVGHDGPAQDYGLSGPSAGGGDRSNKME